MRSESNQDVVYSEVDKAWSASVQACMQRIHIGLFNTKAEASRAVRLYQSSNDYQQSFG